MKPTARSSALSIIDKVLSSKTETVKNLLSASLKKYTLSREDKNLAAELSYGVVRRLGSLDWHISLHSLFKNIDPDIRNILRLGAYQLLFLDKIPPYAAINESVELAKEKGVKSAGFVNAVLRKLDREKREPVPGDFGGNAAKYFSALYSFPPWMIERWIGELGENGAAGLCRAMNEVPHISVRVNTLKIDIEKLKGLFNERGIEYSSGMHPLALRITSNVSLEENDLFREGYFFVQDESTLRIVDLLDPRAGENVLDLCAAPGGKCAYIAQKMGNVGNVVAVDKSPKRLKMLSENIARMGTGIVKILECDLLKLDSRLEDKKFDRVLLDAPCSNQGVLSKRVEARWRTAAEDVSRLSALQSEMLNKAACYVRGGGTLVYSTCSIDCVEDEEVVEQFLECRKDFSLGKMFKTWPQSDNMDGSFAALFIRK